MKKLVLALLVCVSLFGGDLDDANLAYQNGDYKKAVELYQKACDGGSAATIDKIYSDVDPNAQRRQEATKEMTAMLYSLGLTPAQVKEYVNPTIESIYGEKNDPVRIAEAYDGGDARGCVSLGVMYEGGRGVKQNDFKAVELYQKACDGGDALGCRNLGIMHEGGRGVKQNDFKAVELYQKACDGGDTGGCLNLGNMYAYGKGVKQDNFKAVELYKKACDGGDAYGCFNLGVMYEDGKGVKQNSQKALELFGKACDLKYDTGCKNYASLKKQLGQ